MNVRKLQFKNFEVLAEEISFPIMSFCFPFGMFFLAGTEKYYLKCYNVNDAKSL